MSLDLKDLYVKVECPYNKDHKISSLRMPYHLYRCRKNYPDVEMAICPYNASHEVNKPELKYHMTHCPNRTLLERNLSYNELQNAILGKEEVARKGNTELPCPVEPTHSQDDDLENWDEDESPAVFTPQESLRPMRRHRDRRQVESRLRIPQKQSIAASFTMTGTCPDRGSNHSEQWVAERNCDSTMQRITESLSPSSLSSSSSSSSSSHSEDSVIECHPSNVLGSRLVQQMSGSYDNQKPIHRLNHLFTMGRGRARPAITPSSTHSPLFTERPGLSAPVCIRMGRGGFRPTFKS